MFIKFIMFVMFITLQRRMPRTSYIKRTPCASDTIRNKKNRSVETNCHSYQE